MSSHSLYDQLGGGATVNAAVDVFYRKVLKDHRINKFFDVVDMEQQRAKQKAFLNMAFGGPIHYTGRDLREVHSHLLDKGLDDSHFNAFMENLEATLKDLKVNPFLSKEILTFLESKRSDVLGRPNPGA